jgi:hypothetical protein
LRATQAIRHAVHFAVVDWIEDSVALLLLSPIFTPLLVEPKATRRAIQEAYEVDEVKDIRDKALALEIYARQAKNVDVERDAGEIRLRAERRAGQLLKEIEKAKAGRPPDNPSDDARDYRGAPTLKERGISYDQSSRWQKLADVPEEQFEAGLGGPEMPTTSGIIASESEAQPRRDDRSLWLWGRLQDFERNGLLDLDPNDLVATMLSHQRV